MKSVAIITQGYEGWGGTQTIARDLAQALNNSARYKATVLSLAQSRVDSQSRQLANPTTWWKKSLLSPGASPDSFERWGCNFSELEYFRYLPRRELDARLKQFDILQVVSGSAALGNACRRIGKPMFLQVATRVAWERKAAIAAATSGIERLYRELNVRKITQLEQSAFRRASGVLVENVTMRNFLIDEMSLPPELVHFLPPGVDTNRFSPLPDCIRPERYLLSLCRLDDPRKGLDRLLRAYTVLKSRFREAPLLLIAGANDLPEHLLQYIRINELEKSVVIRSNVPDNLLPSLYANAEVFVQSSLEEGLGLSVLEAMSSGVPVVATETDGTRETVHSGKNGYLIPQGSEELVVENLATAIEKCLGPKRKLLGLSARSEVVESFSASINYEKIMSLYDSI